MPNSDTSWYIYNLTHLASKCACPPQDPPGAEENGAGDGTADGAAKKSGDGATDGTEAEIDLSMFDLKKTKKTRKPKKPKPKTDGEGAADADAKQEGEGNHAYETLLERIQVGVKALRDEFLRDADFTTARSTGPSTGSQDLVNLDRGIRIHFLV